MIRHTVTIKLKHLKGSKEEATFLKAAAELRAIPGVKKFEILKQISAKSDYDYGLSMEFDTLEEYETYNKHPQHTAFVKTYWVANVDKFLELDYEVL
jgi:heme-degrading monooxygenase HmoA